MEGAPRCILLLLLATMLAFSQFGMTLAGCGIDAQGSCSGGPDRERRDIIFPGDEEFNPITRYLTPEQIDRLNNIETLDEVVRTFSNGSRGVNLDPGAEPVIAARILPQLSSRMGGNNAPLSTARNSGVRQAVMAKCQPILQPVPLKKSDDLTVMYWPYCVQLERCGGCCLNDRQQSCQPTKTETIPMRVNRFLLNGMKPDGTEIVYLEKHVQCKCSCIVKASDCNSLQEYSPKECKCNCINTDERRKCLDQSNKIWDNSDCTCRCRDYPTEGCTTGLYFDPISCACMASPESRRRNPDPTYKLEKRRRRWQNRTSYTLF